MAQLAVARVRFGSGSPCSEMPASSGRPAGAGHEGSASAPVSTQTTNTELQPARPPPPVPELPEPLSYRIKNILLGRPLVSEQLATERMGGLMAMGVLAPDGISSSAYGTEEMLVELVKYVGVASFALVLPVTFALLLVLLFVTMSYREVVMVYTKAGGSYVVARDNFGPTVAQVAAVALLIDYTVTVAVQIAAGTDACSSRPSRACCLIRCRSVWSL